MSLQVGGEITDAKCPICGKSATLWVDIFPGNPTRKHRSIRCLDHGRYDLDAAPTFATPRPAVQDPINHPTHYTSHPSGVECITITEHMSFLLGNAMKYIWRADLKGGVEDLKKAVWYVEREIAKREAK